MQINPDYEQFYAATISFGWEYIPFYRAWSGGFSLDMLKSFKGPCLDIAQRQSPYAEFFLEFFKSHILTDELYVNRLKKHYKLFKWRIGMTLPKSLPFDPGMPCPCSSGAKYRFCCGRKGSF